MDDLISIVIPLFNYEKYISDCLRSCIEQTYRNIEIIVIDDNSTDNSVKIVEEMIKKDNRIILLKLSKNRGYSVAKNEGIVKSKGKYIVHLDADDMLIKNSIEIRLNEFKKNKEIKFVHGRSYEFKGSKSYDWCLKNINKLKINRKTTIHAQGVMLMRDLYEKYGLYDEKLRSKSDKEMWVRLRDLVGIHTYLIDIPVAFYRKHNDSMISHRERDKKYNNKILDIYKYQVSMRNKEGITKKNTRFI